ncbi:hypothetical protein Ahia01_000768800, partial [Argonauta hians]
QKQSSGKMPAESSSKPVLPITPPSDMTQDQFNKEISELKAENAQYRNQIAKLKAQNKDLLRKLKLFGQRRVIGPSSTYKIKQNSSYIELPEKGFKWKHFLQKKIQVLQNSQNSLRNEMFLRQNLQRQSCLMHHAGVIYKLASPKEPIEVELRSTDIGQDASQLRQLENRWACVANNEISLD